jgi:Uma2 family endonuclease
MAIGLETYRGTDALSQTMTAAEYLALFDAGILSEKAPIFLWKGRIVEKMAKNWPHVKSLSKLYRLFVGLVPDGWFVQQEQPMVLGTDGVPEPDISVYRGSIEDFDRDRRPSSREASLVVEVADTSLEDDRGEVLESYAAAGIPQYWIVNLRAMVLEIYSDPINEEGTPRYATTQILGPDDEVALVLDGREVARFPVREILP